MAEASERYPSENLTTATMVEGEVVVREAIEHRC
jgi:hypothetical protein